MHGPSADNQPSDCHPPEGSRFAAMSRRQLIQSGLVLGLFGLAGCKTTGDVAALPGPVTLPPTGTPPVPNGQPIPPPVPQPLPPPASSITILPRSAWSKALGPMRGNVNPMGGVKRITVHHEGATVFTATDMSTVTTKLEAVRIGHLSRKTKGQPWADIGYHYVIDPAGRVFEGRSIEYQGAHVEDYNPHNLGIMLLGNFDRQSPSNAQLATLQRFVKDQMRRYNVALSEVRTHRECPTAQTRCPGESLQRFMITARARNGGIG